MTPKWEAAFYLRPCLVYHDFDLAESCSFLCTLVPDGRMRAPSRKAAAFTAVLYRLMKMRCNVGQQHRTLSAAVAFPRSLSCVCAQSSARVHLFRSFPARHRCAAQLAAITGRAAGRPQRRRRRRHSRRFRSRWFRSARRSRAEFASSPAGLWRSAYSRRHRARAAPRPARFGDQHCCG